VKVNIPGEKETFLETEADSLILRASNENLKVATAPPSFGEVVVVVWCLLRVTTVLWWLPPLWWCGGDHHHHGGVVATTTVVVSTILRT